MDLIIFLFEVFAQVMLLVVLATFIVIIKDAYTDIKKANGIRNYIKNDK